MDIYSTDKCYNKILKGCLRVMWMVYVYMELFIHVDIHMSVNTEQCKTRNTI